MIPIVVFGAGGHARVVVDTIRATGRWEVVACLAPTDGEPLLGAPVRAEAGAAGLFAGGVRHAFVAIGANALRQRLGAAARAIGFELPAIVSPAATVSPHASVGGGTIVMAGAVIQACAEVGPMCIVNTGATVDHDCRIAEAVHVAPGATLCGNVVVGERAWIGAGSTVIEGTSIAGGVFVCAGATVVRSIDRDGVRVAGTPARALGGGAS